MAIYSFNVSPVSRGDGRPLAAAMAYRSGEKLYDSYYGKTYDYSRRHDVLHKEILLPHNAPREFLDRQTFANAINNLERRHDSQTAREIKIALPNELSLDDWIALSREFVLENFVKLGMGADLVIHEGILDEHKKPASIEAVHERQNNPHAHILLTTRMIDENGLGTHKSREWNSKSYIWLWRKAWADAQNREFKKRGLGVRVSHESYAAQGIDRKPTKHLGPSVMAMEQRNIKTDRGDEYRRTIAQNKERESRKHERQYQRQLERERSFERSR